MKLTEQKLREIIRAELIAEASRSKVFKAARKGSYPVTIVVIENGKVVKQELVKTPEAVPAYFNVIQKEYPKAQINVEDTTGKILFVESKTNESELRHQLAGDSAEDIAKTLKKYGVKGILKQPNDSVTYLQLNNKKQGPTVVTMLKKTFGVESQIENGMYSPTPTVKFDNDQMLESVITEAGDPFMELMNLRGESVDLGEELESLLVDMKDVRSNMEDEGEDGDTKSYGKELNKLEAKYNATKTKLNKVNTKIDKLDQF